MAWQESLANKIARSAYRNPSTSVDAHACVQGKNLKVTTSFDRKQGLNHTLQEVQKKQVFFWGGGGLMELYCVIIQYFANPGHGVVWNEMIGVSIYVDFCHINLVGTRRDMSYLMKGEDVLKSRSWVRILSSAPTSPKIDHDIFYVLGLCM